MKNTLMQRSEQTNKVITRVIISVIIIIKLLIIYVLSSTASGITESARIQSNNSNKTNTRTEQNNKQTYNK
jgi:hypothetical protein